MFVKLSAFKTFFGITKAKTNTECLRYFWLQKYRHFALVKKSFTKTFHGDFQPCLASGKG